MVEIAEVMEEEATPAAAPAANAADARSQERYDDADEIEAVLSHVTRPSARLHLENVITKLRKEGKALQRVAASKASASASSSSSDGGAAMDVESGSNADAPTPIPPGAAAAKDPPVPKRTPATAPILSSNKYQSFPTYYFDAGSYNSATVSVYVPLDGIGQHDRSKIDCNFTPGSFDLVVSEWEGKDYRLLNDNLEKDIDVDKSKMVIKPNKIILRLGKIKGEYGYDSWTQLTAKKAKRRDASGKTAKEDPTAGIMDLMKDMYESGDDNMKKMIGETMYKQRTGQLGKDGMGMDGMDDMMGGMGGMGGMGL